jgi:hypothetical protein
MPVHLEAGRFFYHYTDREAAFSGILPSGTLRLSRYSTMRDPLENQHWRFSFFGGSGERDDTELIGDLAGYDEFERNANEEIRDRSYLLSLTVDAEPSPDGEREPFCRGWARARMWEQYAERYRGVCLVFDRARLAARFEEILGDPAVVACHRQRVIYDGRGMLKPIINAEEMETDPSFLDRYIETNVGSLFFTKTRDWETEHEYRFVVVSGADHPLSVEFGDALTAVIAGDQLPQWQRPAVAAACERVGADPLLIRWSNWRPGLVELTPPSANEG